MRKTAFQEARAMEHEPAKEPKMAKPPMYKGRGGKHIVKIEIRPAKNGGHIVTHHFHERPEHMAMMEGHARPEEHAFDDHEDMMDHVEEMTGKTMNTTNGGAKEKREEDGDDEGSELPHEAGE